ncbi:efflux RND transporter permease subunit [Pleionea sp. CnH1-48]|uniref:efflux RND transporter permease subunit n=1 Tax=Pleionea sp. CnH1-48 TaxID=2954494 RepID=UPI0020970969|nr:efflux RND transporter permease subunit [Pleionea sp. CnH1-48]MCO7226335.1 efflux RND transporter permease subunit [Pleionea sp. CnH1-48]
MKLVASAVKYPVTVTVGIIISIMTGILAFTRVPVQMTPNVDSVVISINTFWENATPLQIESDIITEQERVLGDVARLVSITSSSQAGSGNLRLEFENGTDINHALQQVLQKLDEVPSYPEGVLQPVVEPNDPERVNYISWVGLASTDPSFDPTKLYNFMERRLHPRLERIKGVSKVQIFGASERELQIQVDATTMANYGITYSELATTLRANNQTFSGGQLPDGKSNIRVRTVGRFHDIDTLRNMAIKRTSSGTIYLKDFAEIKLAYKERTDWVRARSLLMPFFSFQLQYGANVIQTMASIDAEIAELNKEGGLLHQKAQQLGIDGTLELVKTYDSSIYVNNAIDLVENNIVIGGILATLTLLLFLRSLSTIGVIAIAIPISVIASVVVLVALGRSINIVSLAGMAFAVGMVIDNAIVVIENIYRHLEMGKPSLKAAVEGTQEVSGAVLASTMTTLVVFVPVLFIQDSAGQLFKDIALAIMAAVGISFIVSVIVMPTVAAKLLTKKPASSSQPWLFKLEQFINQLPQKVSAIVQKLIKTGIRKATVIIVFFTVTFSGIAWLAPPMDYLPKGNFNAAIGILIPPPGYNIDQLYNIGRRIEQKLKPAWQQSSQKFAAESQLPQLPDSTPSPIIMVDGKAVPAPAIDQYFLVAWSGQMIQFAMPKDDRLTVDLVDYLNQSAAQAQIPDVISFAFQFPLFNTGGSTGSAISINLMGDDLNVVNQSASALMFKLMEEYSPYSVVPDPANFLLPTPELKLIPDDERLQMMNMSRQDLGLATAANGDGIILVRAFELDGILNDVKVLSKDAISANPINALMQSPLATPSGRVIDIQNVAEISRQQTSEKIRHVDRLRAVTLQFTPPPGLPLEQAIEHIDSLEQELRANQSINNSVEVNLSGSAGKLKDIQRALMGDGSFGGTISSSLFLALAIIYLVMVVLFQNWFYPMVIMVTVPLATFGGFAGLSWVHAASVADRYQPIQNLDVLTILGFVILAGVVVNNAILIVHQAINFLKMPERHLTPDQAVIESVKSRVRPILMSTLTSIGGMLPLVLMPGAGSELYRGLGAVVVGGLLVATVFTLFLVPVLLSVIFSFTEKQSAQATSSLPEEAPAQ